MSLSPRLSLRPFASRGHTWRRAAVAGVAAAGSLALLATAPGVAAPSPYHSTGQQPTVRVVSAKAPLTGPSVTFAAQRPVQDATVPASSLTPPGKPLHTWRKLFNMPGATVHDIDFPTVKTGYAAAELGQVWKTTDGGKTWTKVLDRGFPYYYYGVEALDSQNLVVSGFNDQTSEGIITWSHDGGATWSADEVLSSNAWVGRIRIPGIQAQHALAMNGEGSAGSNPNVAWYTQHRDQWNQTVPDPNGGWFGYQFSLLRSHRAFASGITYCSSADTGATWSCRNSIDSVFDGATEFINKSDGWVGGGEISPQVAGWLHLTTDGGQTWSDRVLETPWPIRQIEFVSPQVGWAAGGNIYSGVGGIYATTDGGQTWVQDADTGDEVGACAHHGVDHGAKVRVWCVGAAYSGSFSSNVYRTTVPGRRG